MSTPELWDDVAGARDHTGDRDELVDVAGVEVTDDLGLAQVEGLCLH